MKKTNHAQLTTEVFRVRRQILLGPTGAFEQKLYPDLLIFPYPLAQCIRQSEGHKIPWDRQEQIAAVFLQPLLTVLSATLRTMTVIAGMTSIVVIATIRAHEETATHGWGAALKNFPQNHAVSDGHGFSECLQVLRGIAGQCLMESQAVPAVPGRIRPDGSIRFRDRP
ncbi:MAG: hypothetical protein LRY28_00550 [Erysipelotrichaceae bacterium]|nr:hypothetical protein [Erysipelotrichaceae bacterium]